MLHIEQLNLSLPAQMQPHASDIAQRIGALLAHAHIEGNRSLPQLAPPAVIVGQHTSPDEVASRIVQQITHSLGRR